MQHNRNIDDLDYLAQQGFEKVPVSDADLEDLKERVRKRSFSYNNGSYFWLISLLVGIFIGISLFFMLYQPAPDRLAIKDQPLIKDSVITELPQASAITLDTIAVVAENFVRPGSKKITVAAPANAQVPQVIDTVMLIPPKDLDLAALLEQPGSEEKIKYIANAPVFYIHDLKVTDYSSLYFRKNHYVRSNDIAAPYQGREELSPGGSGLKQSADYFLHNQLADALRYFKKGDYARSIYLFDQVAAYNKEDVNCDFYLGLCYYYKKNFARSLVYLERCIGNRNNTFLQEAMYYKALALYESGEKEKALKLFKEIADEGEFYAEKAKAFLRS